MMLIPQGPLPAQKSGPALHIPDYMRRKQIQTPKSKSGCKKNNETTQNISPNDAAGAPNNTEAVSSARAPGNNQIPEQTLAFSHCQSNPLQALAQTQEGEATSPHSLNRAVAKLKRVQIPDP